MVVNVAALEATLDADVRGFSRGMDKADRELSGFQRQTNNAGSTVSRFVKGALIGVGIEGVRRFATASFRAAADLNESINAIEVVFGDAADTIKNFSDTAVDEVGLSARKVNQAATVLGSSLINAGLDAEEAADKTIDLTTRAADMASVFNTDVNTALEAIQAAIRGEIDPIEKFGVSMNAAQVEAKALSEGLHDGTGEMSAQAKVAARLGVIMDQTERVAGDYKNTQDSAANATRAFKERLDETQVAIGQALIPAVEEILPALENLLPAFEQLASEAAEAVAELAPVVSVLAKITSEAGDLASLAPDATDAMDTWSEAGQETDSTLDQFRLTIEKVRKTSSDFVREKAGVLGFISDWSDANLNIAEGLSETDDFAQDLQRTIRGDYVNSLMAAAREADESADATRDLGRAAAVTEDDIEGLDDALGRLIGEEVDAQQAAIDFEQSLADLVEQAQETGTTLDIATQAGRDNQRAVLDAVQATQELIEVSVEEAETVGAASDAVAGHIGQLRESLEQAGLTEDQISQLIDQYNLVPEQIGTAVFADVDQALRAIHQVNAGLRSLPSGRTISVQPGGGPQEFQSGGVVPGPRGAPVPVIAHGGEEFAGMNRSRGGGSRTIHIDVHGSVFTEQDIVRAVQEGIREEERRSGRSRF